MAHSQNISQPRSALELAESIKLVRSLVGLADQQIEKLRVDLGVAIVGLAELEMELKSRGVGQ